MPLRKQNPSPPPPASGAAAARTPAAPPTDRRGRWRVRALLVLVPVLALAGWGAWARWGPNPIREARAAIDRRDFRTASDLLAEYLAEHPGDHEVQLVAARAARRGGDFSRASEHLAQYLRQRRRQDEAYNLEAALLRAHQGNTNEAERLFAEYSGRPDSPDAPLVMEAYLECQLKVLAPGEDSRFMPETHDPAVLQHMRAAAEAWLAARPGNADQVQGLVWQGRVLRYGHDHPGGTAKFRAALARDPDSFDARLHLGLALVQSAPEESMRHFELLHTRRPDDRRLRYYLATGYRSFGRGAESRRLLDEMLAADPNEVSALVELGLLELDEGKPGAAEPLLRKALDRAPDAAETNLAMQRYEQLAGRPEEATKYRKRFEEIEARKAAPAPPRKP